MTVRELILKLQDYPDDLIIVTASDEEGNDFHTTYEITHG